ncbi:MBOAT family O-acyltransferase [Leptolyngbya boryana CZ1]|uniref:MBOAT family O-acyltransferase n=1 Tax=Leptolyngbya boryana CZ1 TaxID=3060204 RepID=A0AA96WTG7_LEPBY|nr:MBOAT family O-acyltransferase [Leptolyngbya boryana]WNZ43979.1 MBOAT family O-acyltransferase [Leptolyngbya boryana CZ1]
MLKARFLQNIFLVIVSYVFYGWWDYRFCAFLLASSIVDFLVGRGLGKTEKPLFRKGLLLISLTFNLSILGFFKYWNFFTSSLNSALSSVGWHVDIITLNVILPVGISFYTFQGLSYSIDVYHRKMIPVKNLIDHLCYLSFFPQLVAGPIERATHLSPQVLAPRSFSSLLAVDGCRQMLWGFFKKMVIADNLSLIVDRAYAYPQYATGAQLTVATIAFAIQIYCDFSAYSDIAIGTARLFGFDLMQNFAFPYFSQSIAEFWRRWHISLSTWLRDYIYIPLGGSRVSPFRRSMNVMITFLASGVWHGASWTYVIWGGLHGALILLEKVWTSEQTLRVQDVPGGTSILPKPKVLLRMLFTFSLICFTWIFFRATSLSDAMLIIGKIVTETVRRSSVGSVSELLQASPFVQNSGVVALVVLLGSFILLEWLQRHQAHPLVIGHWRTYIRRIVYTILFWVTLYWGTWSTGQFVYFQF